MVSFLNKPGEARTPSLDEVARLLQRPRSDVLQLLEEERLSGAILHALRARGAALTPTVKDSVQATVRALEPERPQKVAIQSESVLGNSTATIMFTDVVGSTDLMERMGDRDGRRVLGKHDKIVRRETAAHNGTTVKSMGDGFMLTFASATSGVACASAVQRATEERGGTDPEGSIAVRIGISVGEPVHDSEDLYGMSVIKAARIANKAKGGQVLVSEIVYTLASSSGEFEFRSLGTARLKGIDGKHPLYEVLWR